MPQCDFIFADPAMLERVDAGEPLREYDAAYWESELASARQRAWDLPSRAPPKPCCIARSRSATSSTSAPARLPARRPDDLPAFASRPFPRVEKFPPPRRIARRTRITS
jgi:hypothetical protein